MDSCFSIENFYWSKKHRGCGGTGDKDEQMSGMLPSEVFNLLRVPAVPSIDSSLRKAWLSLQGKPCKDVIALTMPLRKVPTTLEAFRHAMAENPKSAPQVLCRRRLHWPWGSHWH